MSTPQNQLDGELKLMSDMLADLCAAISQVLKTRYPTMSADRRFNYSYCVAVRLIRNHIESEFGQPNPVETHRQN